MNEAAIHRVNTARRCIREAIYRLEMTGLPRKFDPDIVVARIRLDAIDKALAEVQQKAGGRE